MKIEVRGVFTALTLAVALTGCGGKSKEDGDSSGQILEGSTSDAMLPLDQVRSQAPLAPQSGSGEKTSKAAKDASSDSASSPGQGDLPEPDSAEPAADSPPPQ